ncbi:MAG: hypothetical protein AMXMBFR33_43070 [Candidatus Xenobia bacterium]
MIRLVDNYAPVWMPQQRRSVSSEQPLAQDLVHLSSDPARTPEFLKTLRDLATDVAVRSNHANLCAALGAPLIAALVLAARGVAQNPVAAAALGDLLVKWRGSSEGDGYHIDRGKLEEVVRGGDFRVVGNRIMTPCEEGQTVGSLGPELWRISQQVEQAGRQDLVPFQDQLARLTERFDPRTSGDTLHKVQRRVLNALPELATEDYLERELKPVQNSLAAVGSFYGPSRMLDLYLEGQPNRLDSLQLLSHVEDGGFVPEQRQVDGMVKRLVGDLENGNGRDSEWTFALLDAVARQTPGSVSIEQRRRLQQALLEGGKKHLSLATWHGPVGRLAAADPELVPGLLARQDEATAQALLLSAPLDQEQWTRMPVDPDVRFAYDMADFARQIKKLTPQEALTLVESFDTGRFGRASDAAEKRVRSILLAHLASHGDYPQFAQLKDWESLAFYPYLTEGVRQGRTAETMAELDSVLERLQPGRLCYQSLAGELAALAGPKATLTQLAERYLALHQGTDFYAEGKASQGLQLFGRGTEEEFQVGRAWLEPLAPSHELVECLKKLNAMKEDFRPDWSPALFGRLNADLEAFMTLQTAGEAGLPRLNDLRNVRAGQANAAFPAAWSYRGEDWDGALAGLQRLSSVTGEQGFLGATETYFQALNEGGSVEQALDRALRRQIAGAVETSPVAIGEQGGRVVIGGSLLRHRSPGR